MKTIRILPFACICLIMLLISSCAKDEDIFSAENIEPEVIKHHLEHRNCGFASKMRTLLQDPEYRKAYEQKLADAQRMSTELSTRSACSDPTIVPVAIHYQGVNNPDRACLVQLAQNQLQVLNDDFKGTNSDIDTWNNTSSSTFPGVSNGEACITFVLADQNHPSGYDLNNGDPAVTINKTNGDSSNDWSGYINFFVMPNTGVLGYSPLGGNGDGDGVVVDANAFGTGSGCGNISPQAPFVLGRTLTHELGHYLLLDHIWGNNGGCNEDDNVADTPNQSQENYGCPNLGIQSCGSADLHMNYMDYSDDPCMYMFTAGQVQRMENYLNSSLTNVTNNAANVYSGGGNTGGGGNDDGGNDDDDNGGNDDDDNDDDTGGNDDDDNESDTCETPQSIEIVDVDDTKAIVRWNAVANAIKYRLRYRSVGTSTWMKRTTVQTSKILIDLTPDTDYEVQLRTKCPNGWTSWSAKEFFTTEGELGDDCDGYQITFELTLDDYGSETTWEIVTDNGSTIAQGGPYQDGQDGQSFEEDICLADGCYTLYVDDAYGDGICCDYGDGSFEILDENGETFAASDGNFGYYDYIDFCIDTSGFRKTGERKDEKSSKLAKKPSIGSDR